MRKVGGTFGLLSRDQEEFVAVMGFLIAGVFMLVKPDNFMLPYLRIPAAGYKLSIARHGVRIARNKSILEQHGKRVAILLMRIFGAVFIMIPLLYLLF